MDERSPEPATRKSRGVTARPLVLLLGAVEVGIIYVLVAVETPFSGMARRATETWGGRIALAGVGWLVITVCMIAVLTISERRGTRG